MCYNTVTMIKYSTKVKLVSGNVLRMGVLAPVLNKFNTHPRVMNLLDDGGAQLTFLHTYGKVVLININNSLLSPVKDALLSSRGNCDLILQDDVNLAIKMIRSINDSDYYTYNYARYFKTDNIVGLFYKFINSALNYLVKLLTPRTVIYLALYLSDINTDTDQLKLIKHLRNNDGCDYISE